LISTQRVTESFASASSRTAAADASLPSSPVANSNWASMPSARTLAAAAATLSRAEARTKRFTGGGGGGGLTTADGRVAANAPAAATTSAQATAAAMRPGWRRDAVDASSSVTSSSSLLESSKTQLSLGVAMTMPSSSWSLLETASLAAIGLATSSKPSPMAPLSRVFIILRESLHLDLVNCV